MSTETGSGRGSAYQERGRWTAKWRRPDGRQIKERGFPTKDAALDWLEQQRIDHRRGIDVGNRTTVAQLLDRWLDETVRPHRAAKTVQGYEWAMRVHLNPAIGKRLVADLTTADVQAVVNRLVGAGKSYDTVRIVRSTLRAALNQAVVWGLAYRNVAAKGVKLPSAPAAKVEVLTRDEARAVLKAVEGHRLEALFQLAVSVGARQGELLGLRWGDLNERTGELTFRRQVQRQGGAYVTTLPKQHSVRSVWVGAPLLAAIRQHRERQRAEAERLGRWADPGLMFANTTGGPLNGNYVTHAFQRLLARAGYDPMRFHLLRHSAASLMLAMGCTMLEVSKTLGHRDVSVTMNIYAHLLDDAGQRVAERMAALWG